MTAKISRKQEILDAALQCFIENGIEATTIDMIRERSSASVGSMYHHFGNKERIASAIYVDAMRDHYERLQGLLATAKSAESGVKAIVNAYIGWVSDNPDKAQFVLHSRGALAKAGATGEIQEETETRLSVVLDWFEPFIKNGALRKLPRECYASLILGPAHDYARLWLSGRVTADIETHRKVFADAAWRAVKPD